MTKIAIVDKDDNLIGSGEKSAVYQMGSIHRLIRIILINDKGEILLQWRSAKEDTSPNMWDQSVGGHVDEGEDYMTAAKRELKEELGVTNVDLVMVDKYFTEYFAGDRTIKRFNAVFVGKYSGEFVLQKEEVDLVEWFDLDKLPEFIEEKPEDFTAGLKGILKNQSILDSLRTINVNRTIP